VDRLIGREAETRRLQAALHARQSQLIWGPADSGKTSLVRNALSRLPDAERQKCICSAGATSRRRLVEHLIQGLYLAGDAFVRKRVHADRETQETLPRWINQQSLIRIRGILFTAAEQGDYRFVVDDLPPASHSMAHLLKEITYRTKTPIYLTGLGYTQSEIGYAWSLYWTDEYRIRLGPLPEARARELLETCIQKFGLSSLDLEGFREEVLHLSAHLPGSIVKMCELAAEPRYHYGDQVKVKLVHLDYLLQGSRFSAQFFAGHTA
jgi:AAA ATPase domain